ncbi:hypothetical protein MKX03_024089 [Papaver bracteatum]|nr:hypothetical protein MKX03_024089 [Papaver bracteatum]
MASTLLKTFLDPKKNRLAGVHKKAIANRLTHYEALNRLPVEVVDARNQRLKRAMDLSMKHEYLSPELQMSSDVRCYFVRELLAEMRMIHSEKMERDKLYTLAGGLNSWWFTSFGILRQLR